MFSVQHLRKLVRERLAAAAEEIITEFEQTIDQYGNEMDRRHRSLNICCCPQIKIHRIVPPDFSQQLDGKEEELLADQQLWNHERNSVLDQEEPEPPHVKEEQEELFISQEGEQLVVKLEADAFMVTPVSEENKQREAEPNGEQLLSYKSAVTEIHDEEGSQHVNSESSKEEEPKAKKRRLKTRSHSNSDDDSLTSKTLCGNETDAPQLHDSKEKRVPNVQQVCNQERASSLGPEEEELCTSQEEHFGLKQETDFFMMTVNDEDSDNSETEPNGEQLLSHNCPDTESQADKNVNPGSSNHEGPKSEKRLHRNRSNGTNVDNFPISENHGDTDTGEKTLKCCDNDRDLKIESQKMHHTVDKPHVCNTCGKRFRRKSHLLVHERIHTGEKPFSCATCGQNFRIYADLKIHMRIHTGEKPFSCETCGKSFNQHGNLKIHMRIHTGEKPFSCGTCGQSFNQHGYLKKHMRTHIDEKPFSCETCGKSFKRHDHLKVHMRHHTGEKPFSCAACGQSFCIYAELKIHMRIHTGEKPFSCEICGKVLINIVI
ncbi:uncharacterized protein KZ484_015741 isoform 2-T2 [Pholidichthys leucotaenia]